MAETITQRIHFLLRRDLKLGNSIELRPDTPLMGSSMDLDSLDVLLLITNLEKEFGIKIASQEMGAKIFKDVGSLTEFIAGKVSGKGSAPATPAASASPADLLSRLPHREPFRFVTQVTRVDPQVSGEGIWSVSGGEAFFAGHFPGNPLVPGVLIAEALAQMAGLVGADGATSGRLAQVDVRFTQPVTPPAQITLQAKQTKALGQLRMFEVSAQVKGATVAEGTVTLAFPDAPAGKAS